MTDHPILFAHTNGENKATLLAHQRRSPYNHEGYFYENDLDSPFPPDPRFVAFSISNCDEEIPFSQDDDDDVPQDIPPGLPGIEETKEPPTQLWITSLGNNNEFLFRSKWINNLTLSVDGRVARNSCKPGDNLPPDGLDSVYSLIWRELDDSESTLNPLAYIQSADIVFVTIDAVIGATPQAPCIKQLEHWIKQAEYWMKEILDSNTGNLLGIVFLIRKTREGQLSEDFLWDIQRVRRKFGFSGTVFAHLVPVAIQQKENGQEFEQYASGPGLEHCINGIEIEASAASGIRFTNCPEELFTSIVDLSISYIMKCHKRTEGISPGKFEVDEVPEYVRKRWSRYCRMDDNFYKIQSSLNPTSVNERPQNEVIQARSGFANRKQTIDEQYTTVKTSIWDYELFEDLQFSFLLFFEALLNMTVFLHEIRAILKSLRATAIFFLPTRPSTRTIGARWLIRERTSSTIGVEMAAHAPSNASSHPYVDKRHTPPSKKVGSIALNYRKCARCISKCARLRHIRSFWGAGKGLFVRNPWRAVTRKVTIANPIGYSNEADRRICTRVNILLAFFTHCACVLLLGLAIYFSLNGTTETVVRQTFRAAAHQYITLFTGICFLYAGWAATTILPKQWSRIRQCSFLVAPKSVDDLGIKSKAMQMIHRQELEVGGNIMRQGLDSMLRSVLLFTEEDYRTTEEIENIILNDAQQNLVGYRKTIASLWGIAAVILHVACTILSRIVMGRPVGLENVTERDRVGYWMLRIGSGALMGIATFMILYLADGTASMCLETMETVTNLLTVNENCGSFGSKRKPQKVKTFCCGRCTWRSRQENSSVYILPLIPLNVYGWIHIRQNLFYQTQGAFAESSCVFLIPMLMVALAVGHLILVLVQGKSIALRSTVLIDALFALILLLFVMYRASGLRRLQIRQVQLLANQQTVVEQLEDQLRRKQIEKDANRANTGTVELLRQTSKALALVRETVRESVLALAIWPGIVLSPEQVMSIVIGLVTLMSTVIAYVTPYFNHQG
eukprot:gb/GECG01009983.1/.p1 GENE.gb/GECG01009983.1/~~gb/GECG01009983.1/.p1  ORF type:complete len:1016 (+),score=80.45 gb/GECG01009983.1/:1-3048(+)